MGDGDSRHGAKEGNSPFLIAFAMLAFGVQTLGIWLEEALSGLGQVYCTAQSCLTLPQVLTGWAIAVAPLPLYLWHRRAAIYLAVFLAGLMCTLFIAADQDTTGLWVLPASYLLVALLFVPISLGIARLVQPNRRTLVVAAQHWLLLAGLLLWLA